MMKKRREGEWKQKGKGKGMRWKGGGENFPFLGISRRLSELSPRKLDNLRKSY